MPGERSHAALVWTKARGKEAKATPYLAARVVGRDPQGDVKLAPESGAPVVKVAEQDTVLRNPPGTRPDNCQLLHMNEACVLENVSARFDEGQIYTWTSHVLTAVNPYEELPLYSDKLAKLLPTLNTRDLPPHVFAVAELAVRGVVRGPQAVVVSGESGAGKTVSMSYVMAYLTQRTRNTNVNDQALGHGLGTLLLQSNPVMEAFGNAQTVRNHNSSRFGKFIKITFDASGTRLIGMSMQTYLLEKVRVVSPSALERTYHVFYAMLEGASPELIRDWGVKPAREHALTGRSKASFCTDAAAAHGSAQKYRELLQALAVLTLRDEEQLHLLNIVAAILHLCDVRFDPLSDSSDGGCRPIGTAALAQASRLLGCPGLPLRLVQRVIVTGRQEPITVALSAPQAAAARDALCKALYVAAFQHIGSRFDAAAAALGASLRMTSPAGPSTNGSLRKQRSILRSPTNESLTASGERPKAPSASRDRAIQGATSGSGVASTNAIYSHNYEEAPHGTRMYSTNYEEAVMDKRTYSNNYESFHSPNTRNPAKEDALPFIGLLDMFGFEIFDVNSLEQLCINFANERLQGYFQSCVFVAEEEVHRLEGVPWPADLEYHDNRGCISLIEKSIFALLDEACGLQNPVEENFFLRVHERCCRDQFFTAPRRKHLLEEEGFIVRHFAGDVCYCSAAAAKSLTQGGVGDTNNVLYSAAVGDTWLVKNADRLLPELESELRSSSSPLVAMLFSDEGNDDTTGPGAGRKRWDAVRSAVRGEKQHRMTVVRRFRADLDALLKDLSQTKTLFVRCIKPNESAAARVLDRGLVLNQLRCLGMTDVVRLMHKAFPTRIPYAQLHGRYATGLPPVLASLSPRDFCEAVALMCDVSPADMHLGTTRLFLRGGKGAFLEDLGEMDINQAMPLLLAKIEEMNQRRSASSLLARAIWTYHLRHQFQQKRTASMLINRVWRGRQARMLASARRAARRRDLEAAANKTAHQKAARPEVAAAEAAKFAAAISSVPGLGYREGDAADVKDSSTAHHTKDDTTAPPLAHAPSAADEVLYNSLGIAPLCSAQLRAVAALRQRLGEHLDMNTTEVMRSPGGKQRAPDSGAPQDGEIKLPPRRRLSPPKKADQKKSSNSKQGSWIDSVYSAATGEEVRIEASLMRDPRDGTLGIDLDQFAGLPTVAVVVPGGPADRDGTVRVGDIVLAVDGIAVESISSVIAILTSPASAAKNPLPLTIVRKPTVTVAENTFSVRAISYSCAADGLSGLSASGSLISDERSAVGELAHLAAWKRCKCALHSDRRLTIREETLKIDYALDLRAALSFQVVVVNVPRPATSSSTQLPDPPGVLEQMSCLQIRTNDGIIEFTPTSDANVARDGSVIRAWQRPLEEMLMLSLASSFKGWLLDISSPQLDLAAPTDSRVSYPSVFLDLNSRSQVRTILGAPRPEGSSHVGVIELAELQEIEVMSTSVVEALGPHAAAASGNGPSYALQLATLDHTCLLACENPDAVQAWAQRLKEAHRRALVALVQYTGMILIDGWLDYQGDEDEWAGGFFVLTIGAGLQCFETSVTDPSKATPIETIPISQITGAVRSKGIDYYDWCIDIRTTDNDYIRVRPPRQAEMTRWLATLNLYCTPAVRRKPDRPRRQSYADEPESPKPQTQSKRVHSTLSSAIRPPDVEPEGGVPGNAWDIPLHKPRPPQSPRPNREPRVQTTRSLDTDDVAQHVVTHSGLLQGWSSTHGSSLGAGPVNNPAPNHRRALSFSRRRSASSMTSQQLKPAPSRGGRLQTSNSKTEPKSSSHAGASDTATAPNAKVQGVAGSAMSGKLAIRRPSFGRRRGSRAATISTLDAQPVTVQTETMASAVEPNLQMPNENAPLQRPPLRTRALSFTRARRSKSSTGPTTMLQVSNRGSTAPAAASQLLPPQVLPPPPRTRRVDMASSVPLSKSPTELASDASSESSERAAALGAVLVRSNSFSKKIRRAASFSSRRRRDSFEETH